VNGINEKGEMLRKAIKKVFPHRQHRYKCSRWVIGWGNDAVVTSAFGKVWGKMKMESVERFYSIKETCFHTMLFVFLQWC
jgi:hypothetical protein